jgi:MFS family permease
VFPAKVSSVTTARKCVYFADVSHHGTGATAEVRRLSDDGTVQYRAVFTNHTAWRIWLAATISYFGDFVGLGALLLAGYSRSGGHPLGSAAVFGIQAVPAFVISVVIGPWLDHIPRRGGLITLSLLGGVAVALPIMFSGLWAVLVAAAGIGGIRTAFNSVRTGAIADGVPRTIRGRLVALLSTSNQVFEVVGYVAGSSIAIAVGTGSALATDAATFVIAAALLAGLRLPAASRSPRRASMTTGIRTIFADRTLALLVPVAWIGLSLGAVPQSLAAAELSKTERGWVPLALAAMAAGAAISATVVGRTRLSERILGQFGCMAASGAAFMVTAVAMRVDPRLVVAGNLLVGLGFGWTVAAQTTFIHVIPVERIAHVTSTMIGSLIVLEGAGAVAAGAIAGAFGVPAAYLLGGGLLTVTALAAIGYGRTHTRALDLSRPHPGVPAVAALEPPAREVLSGHFDHS